MDKTLGKGNRALWPGEADRILDALSCGWWIGRRMRQARIECYLGKLNEALVRTKCPRGRRRYGALLPVRIVLVAEDDFEAVIELRVAVALDITRTSVKAKVRIAAAWRFTWIERPGLCRSSWIGHAESDVIEMTFVNATRRV